DDGVITHLLQQIGCKVTVCANSDEGMAASLVHALMHAQQAQGWVIALGDMPYVQSATIRALAAELARGAQIAVPVYRGRRGNPVAFARTHLPELLTLHGDEGARRLLKTYPVVEVATADHGIVMDIDTLADLDGSNDA
ncbi:MAG: nucleotidyltransferase family protein, partial [Noviherbaspirillum sp.]